MILKPKSTVGNPLALHYKRFTRLEASYGTDIVYLTTSTNQIWLFDSVNEQFIETDSSNISSNAKIRTVEDFNTILQYGTRYYRFNGSSWQILDELPEDVTLLSASFNNIGKYQTNKYYYVNSFDYMIKGSIAGATTQYIKGNIMPLTSLNIKYFDDDVGLCNDDLVVIDKRLYSVENPETVQKRQPYVYNVYFATLNSIL